MWQLLTLLLVAALPLGWLVRGYWVRRSAARNLVRAIEFFAPAREGLEVDFLSAAAKSGRPRGLHWKGCDLEGEPVFAIDRTNGDIFALLAATIRFAAIPGGGMEDVRAVGDLRHGTAVFRWDRRHWTTDGRVLFNLAPAAALLHYRRNLEPVVTQHDPA